MKTNTKTSNKTVNNKAVSVMQIISTPHTA